ncbi:MAG: L,D-transpeptidase [Thermomicrobiales bacterium]
MANGVGERSRTSMTWAHRLLVVVLALTLLPGTGVSAQDDEVRAPDAPAQAEGQEEEAPPGAGPVEARFAVGLDIAADLLPPDLGATEQTVYVGATGHSVGGWMLDYWRANGATVLYGDPISEPFSGGGYYSQAFERGVFQFYPELLWTELPAMGMMPIGYIALDARVGETRADGRRASGGGDRRAGSWLAQDPASAGVATAYATGLVSETTGHTVTGSFWSWYRANEGAHYLGAPLGEPMAERGQTVQYFERGLLLEGNDGVRLAPLPGELIARGEMAVDTAPIARGDMPEYDEAALVTAYNPAPTGATGEGRRWLEVDVAQQVIRAYQGETVVMESYVSTGLKPNETETGRFHVRIKRAAEDMSGFTDSTGEVVSNEDQTDDPNDLSYEVADVPNVLYFNQEAEALHGAYWHNNFGNRMSHGCVNLPLDVAAFLFEWAPLGTEVWVHDVNAVETPEVVPTGG